MGRRLIGATRSFFFVRLAKAVAGVKKKKDRGGGEREDERIIKREGERQQTSMAECRLCKGREGEEQGREKRRERQRERRKRRDGGDGWMKGREGTM